MAKKKEVRPKFVMSASGRVSRLGLREGNPGSSSEEDMEWGAWKEKREESCRDQKAERGRKEGELGKEG